MDMVLQELIDVGLDAPTATDLCQRYQQVVRAHHDRPAGEARHETLLPLLLHGAHVVIRKHFFESCPAHLPPLWYPSLEVLSSLNVSKFMRSLKTEEDSPTEQSTEQYQKEFESLLHLAWHDPDFYWSHIIDFMDLRFVTEPERILTHASGEDDVVWLKGCRLNVADMALQAISEADRAIIWADENRPDELCYMSGDELKQLSYQIASAIAAKYKPGTSVAVYLPMTAVSVGIYLGIVLAGCIVVSIADSFATPEVKTRLAIANTKLIFTQDVIRRAGKIHDLYSKIANATTATCIVLPENLKTLHGTLAPMDVSFQDFLEQGGQALDFCPVSCDGYDSSNILFSSGTTGTPKAIPWTHLTPIKCGVDGMLGQNIHPNSIVCWPTSLGWMMGPWLIYSAYLNKAPIALFQGSPTTPAFCKFVEAARVTMLGVIPSIVRAWKDRKMTQNCDWSSIECFSSTGEASGYEEYHWLMAQAGYKPVIEYCGGTEMGGAYISSSLVYPQTPSGFTTPIVGCSVVHMTETHIQDIRMAEGFEGELAVEPPMFGLSQSLLNKNHVEVYYQGMPRYGAQSYRLRRHGDAFAKLDGVYFSRGRCDDTMNLGGIKVSCVELEYVVMKTVKEVKEAAAVGFTPDGGGPEELFLFLVLSSSEPISLQSLKEMCQKAIKEELNPLFKVSQVHLRDELPRTSSNKLTRNVLRDELKHIRTER